MTSIILPNFVLAGVARCGTTSLFHYLKQHPDIGFPSKKEPKYFSSIGLNFPHAGPGDETVDEGMIRTESEYVNLFRKLGGYDAIGEASSDYFFFHERTVEQIKALLGDVAIIILLRNPVERAYSAFNNLVRDGREKLSFLEALSQEEERMNSNWDWMWAYKRGGLYSDGILHFRREFSRVKVILFDDFERKPELLTREVFSFLGVRENVSVNTATKYSHSGTPRNLLMRYLTTRDNKFMYALRKTVMSAVPRNVLESIAEKVLKKNDMSERAREYLTDYFKRDIERLEDIIDRDLSAWKSG